MSTYTVQTIKPFIKNGSEEQETHPQYGKSWSIFLKDAEGQTYSIIKSYKEGNEPKTGDTITGTMAKNEQGYWRFTADKPAFGGGYGAKTYGKSPEEQVSIIRQSSLKAAIDFFAGVSPEQPKTEELLLVAEKFAHWVQNPPRVVSRPTNQPPLPIEEDPIGDLPF